MDDALWNHESLPRTQLDRATFEVDEKAPFQEKEKFIILKFVKISYLGKVKIMIND